MIALIPARNESKVIHSTIASLKYQTVPLDKIVVVANNCDDDTAGAARKAGAYVFEMTKNEHMKSGALNYALEQIVPKLSDEDCILIMDADTVLSHTLVEKCLNKLEENERAGAVSSIFTGRPVNSLLGTLQMMEYWRYRRQILRNGGRAFVLTGTASLFPVKTLKDVKKARKEGRLPNGGGSFYDIKGRTEDNEMTLAILKLGYDCPAADVYSATDVMGTLSKLANQRERWYNGALVNLKAYGLTLPWNMRWVYWKQQFGLLLSMILFLFILTTFFISLFFGMGSTVSAFWLIPLGVSAIERTVTVWELGWKARIIALCILPEQIYSIFLLLIFGLAVFNFISGKKGGWSAT